jgi:hypothetical protein
MLARRNAFSMLMRWVIRLVSSAIGLGALLGVAYAVHGFASKDPLRARFREGVEASGAVRAELGRDCNLRVEPVAGSDDGVAVTVEFPDPPVDGDARRELVRNTNIVVRRFVHQVRDLKVVFDLPEVIPSWDGGVAAAGTPQPIGVRPPPPPILDAGTPKLAAPKGKTGMVTLVTFPEANVFRGARKLGRTPLFNAELPVGTHLLTLVGDDGEKHRLSVPVRPGKNAPLKMNLAELPAP